MSSLNENLQSIYNIKLQIKDAIGTDSDVFAEYPSLIEEAIGEGGGSGSGDPFYNRTTVEDMIGNEESSADSVITIITHNFSLTLDGNDEIEAVEWDYYTAVSSVPKIVHVIVSGDPHGIFPSANDIAQYLEDHSELYENIYPTLENATLTASEDPSDDGYDYLLEGDIYAWNLSDNANAIGEFTDNGFYTNDGYCGFEVNVGGGSGDPVILVEPWASGVYESGNSYQYTENFFMQPLANSLQCELMTIHSLEGAQWYDKNNSVWVDCGANQPVNITLTDESDDPEDVGGFGFLKFEVDLQYNTFGRVKFNAECETYQSVGGDTFEGDTNWVTFEITTVA